MSSLLNREEGSTTNASTLVNSSKNKSSGRFSKKLKLSCRGLSNINTSIRPKDFSFIIDNKHYKCQSFFADFISPIIARIHINDPSMNSFHINVKDPCGYFQLVMDAMHGRPININSAQREFIKNVSVSLGNTELIMHVQDIKVHSLTPLNALSSLEEKNIYGLDVKEEIECIASNFYKFSPKLLAQLDIDILKRILHSPNLVIDSETNLFNFIMSLVEKDHKYVSLFSALVFSALKDDEIIRFKSVIKYEDLDPLLLNSLMERLMLNSVKFEIPSRYIRIIRTFLFKGESEMFDGIFNFLRNQNDGTNPIDAKVVSATVGIEDGNHSKPRELFERKAGRWSLAEKENNYIMFDFKGAKVSITGYSWGSGRESSYWEYPVSFTWEGSDDNKVWTEIDKKDENTEMGGNEKKHYWECAKSPFYRYIRFRLRNVKRKGGLYCSQLELFGNYQEPEKDKKAPVKYYNIGKPKMKNTWK